MGSTFDVKCDLILALCSQVLEYLRETFYSMPWGTRNQLVQKKKSKQHGLFLRKRVTILLTFFKAFCRWRHVFATCASPEPLKKKNWPCRPLPLLVVAVSMILSM